jgi:hypothetical protein
MFDPLIRTPGDSDRDSDSGSQQRQGQIQRQIQGQRQFTAAAAAFGARDGEMRPLQRQHPEAGLCRKNLQTKGFRLALKLPLVADAVAVICR